MKVQVLGSAAAEGVPGYFCECPICIEARENKGKNLRRRTSYLLDDDTLIDCGPDFARQRDEFHVQTLKLKRIIFTHAHKDHLDIYPFLIRQKRYSVVHTSLTIIADTAPLERIRKETGCTFEEMFLREKHIAPGDTVQDEDLTVYAVRAAHPIETTPLNYFLTRNGKTVLFQNDSGWWSDETWKMAAEYDKKADMVILESTTAFGRPDFDAHHLGANATLRFRDRLLELGIIRDNAVCIVNHFSHHGDPRHERLEKFFLPHNIIPAYDGMVAEI
ncbi:MAG: hypothetical protein IKB16_05935 [Lentisphaeria bacterium]|nr:hypothetical protein [Lentisphaeria bacterium]